MGDHEAATAAPEQKLLVDKFAEGDVVCLRFAGVLDEDFDRHSMPVSNRRATVLHLGGVDRISSFGIREWVDYVQLLEKRTTEIVLIECSPKVMDQINMVANFAGSGIVYSFKAPFHCDYCEHDEDVLIRVDEEWESIQRRKLQRKCSECGQPAEFDGDQVTYLASMVTQGRPEIDPDIAAFVAKTAGHVSPASRRIHVEKEIEGRYVYLKLIGDLGARFPRGLADSAEGTVIFDVGGVATIDQDGIDQWTGLIEEIKHGVDGILLHQVPPMFLVKLLKREELGQRMQVLSISVPYRCEKCEGAASHVIDVEREFDLLHQGQPPDRKCPDCHGSTQSIATDAYRIRWKDLPRPTRAAEPRKLIKKIERKKQADSRIKATELQPRRRQLGLLFVFALLAAVATAGAVFLYFKLGSKDDEQAQGLRVVTASSEARPGWVPEGALGYGHCEATSNGGMSCVGVSSHWRSREEARVEAQEAALEALATALGERVEDATWIAVVREAYTAIRAERLAALDAALETRREESRFETPRKVRRARKRVAKLLRETGGDLLPRDTHQEYWEELKIGAGDSMYLVGAQYEIASDQVIALAELFTLSETAQGVTTVTLFPSLLWRYPELKSGVFVIAVEDGLFSQAGLQAGAAIAQIEGRHIRSSADCVRVAEEELGYLKERGGTLTLQVIGVDGDLLLQGLDVKVAAVAPKKTPGRIRRKVDRAPTGRSAWDEHGGNVRTGRDNPLE